MIKCKKTHIVSLLKKSFLPKVFWTNLPFESLLLAPSHSSYIWSEYGSYLESRSLSFQRRYFWILWSRYCSGQTSSTLYRRFAGRTWARLLVVAGVQKVVWGRRKGWDGEDGSATLVWGRQLGRWCGKGRRKKRLTGSSDLGMAWKRVAFKT